VTTGGNLALTAIINTSAVSKNKKGKALYVHGHIHAWPDDYHSLVGQCDNKFQLPSISCEF